MFNLEDENTDSQQSDYQIKPDVALTPTQIKEIERQKQELLEDLAKQKDLKDTFNVFAVKAVIYSTSRLLLLLGGDIGAYFGISALFGSFMHDSKSFLQEDSIQYDEGLKVNSMNKVFKFLMSLGAAAFFAYNTVGDYWSVVHLSNDAYRVIDEKVERFNTPSNSDEETFKKIAFGAGVAFVILIGGQMLSGKRR